MKATTITTSDGHELIYGPAASGKTRTAKQCIASDYEHDRDPWIIDPGRINLPEEEEGDRCRIASTVKEARALLYAACGIHVGRFGIRRRSYPSSGKNFPITVTIEEASEVFRDAACRQLTERLVRCARKQNVRLRVIVRNLNLESFGGSELIRSALVSDDPVDQAMAVYDNLNATEQREVFRTMYRAVAAYRYTGNTDRLIRFAESMHGMVILETRHPDVREQIRNAPKTVREAGGTVDTADVIRQLREA